MVAAPSVDVDYLAATPASAQALMLAALAFQRGQPAYQDGVQDGSTTFATLLPV